MTLRGKTPPLYARGNVKRSRVEVKMGAVLGYPPLVNTTSPPNRGTTLNDRLAIWRLLFHIARFLLVGREWTGLSHFGCDGRGAALGGAVACILRAGWSCLRMDPFLQGGAEDYSGR